MSNETQTVLDDLIASARDNGRYCAGLPDMQRIMTENGYGVTVGRHFLIWLSTQLPEHIYKTMPNGMSEIFTAWEISFAMRISVKPVE